jgi:hypothetical protein
VDEAAVVRLEAEEGGDHDEGREPADPPSGEVRDDAPNPYTEGFDDPPAPTGSEKASGRRVEQNEADNEDVGHRPRHGKTVLR